MILGKISDERELVETSAGAFEDCLKIQYEAKQPSYETDEFSGVREIDTVFQDAKLKAVESEIREELTDLLTPAILILDIGSMGASQSRVDSA